jgi:hypothetical protein
MSVNVLKIEQSRNLEDILERNGMSIHCNFAYMKAPFIVKQIHLKITAYLSCTVKGANKTRIVYIYLICLSCVK